MWRHREWTQLSQQLLKVISGALISDHAMKEMQLEPVRGSAGKELATSPDDLSLTLQTNMVEGEN